MNRSEIIQQVRAIIDEAPHQQQHTIPPALYDEYESLVRTERPWGIEVDEGLARAGYQNIIPGLFSYTIVRGQP